MRDSMALKAMLVAVVLVAGSSAYGNAYSNDFTAPEAMAKWTVLSGTWQHNAGAGTYSNTTPKGQTSLSVYTGKYAGGVDGTALYDYTVTVEVTNNGGSASIVARYADTAHYYMFRYKSVTGELQLYRFAAGATNLATKTVNAASVPAGHTLVFTLKGSQLTGKLCSGSSEIAEVTATDTTYTHGGVGLREYDGPSTFSSISVDIIGNGFAPDPADGAVAVPTDATLTWHTGLDPDNLSQHNSAITRHYVYMSTDVNDILYNWGSVRVATVSATGATASYKPAALLPDTTYFWAIDESVNNSGPDDDGTILGSLWSFQTVKAKPVVRGGPNDVFVAPGDTAQISIAVESASAAHYAWYKGDVGVTTTPVGTDSAALAIAGASAANEGLYWCRISNVAGSVDSAAANLYLKRLLAHWTLDAADFAGGKYVDVAGDNDATVTGDPNFIAGADGTPRGAVAIGATSGFATGPTLDPTAQADAMTISMWLNWKGINSQHQRPLAKRDADWTTAKWHVLVNVNTANLEFESYADGSGPMLALTADNAWEHVCIVYDSNTATLYVNGVDEFNMTRVATASVVPTPAAEASVISIGAGDSAGGYWFNGAMDDVRIYNYPMELEEVVRLWSDVTKKNACLNPLAADLNGDCRIDFADLSLMASEWLGCGLYPDCP